MATQRAELRALENLISQADHILATAPAMPENRTTACRELLTAALALTGDLLKESRPTSAAVTLGRKGGSITSKRHGPEHYRQMAANRKTFGGGRPRKDAK
jgi:hypothetical protein